MQSQTYLEGVKKTMDVFAVNKDGFLLILLSIFCYILFQSVAKLLTAD